MIARPQGIFAAIFGAFALLYTAAFNFSVMTDADAAQFRFDVLTKIGAKARAAGHGERVLTLRRAEGVDEETLAPMKARVADALAAGRQYEKSAALYEQTLATEWGATLGPLERAKMRDVLARARMAAEEFDKAADIYVDFLRKAGDEAARRENQDEGTPEAYYADRVYAAADLFAEALKPTGSPERFEGSPAARLAAATRLAELGAFYAMREDSAYAAAGLLSSAYEIRRQLLRPDDSDTVQVVLILGPVFTAMGRLEEAERLYLEAFHAQERAKGANNPDLSLYMRLLVDVYRLQGRNTEAQALWELVQRLFRDAFGDQRYASNRTRDRRWDVDRPVSQYFVLDASYAPKDLVRASDFSIPVSKHYTLDEMKVRRATDPGADADDVERTLPGRLAVLLSRCREESGERLSLRSGYRSHRTQADLFARNGARGKTAPPGMSEHQTGLAVDIDVNGRLMRRSDKTYRCFEEHAYTHGFILSYPPGNDYLPGQDTFEPWHWRYVGVETAQLYREAGPMHKPQEFLAALPCYREKAATGALAALGEQDVCLDGVKKGVADAAAPVREASAAGRTTKRSRNVPPQTSSRSAATARNLNDGGKAAPSD
ncbi:MAG: D-alanyl-D-alanine carboxypeptidase family protein [Pseudomonadota bacterium]